MLALLLALQAGSAGISGPRAAVRPSGPDRFDRATFDALVERGIQGGAYPGAALVVGRRDKILFAKGYGHFTWSPSSAVPDPDSTLYDLASLTKILATTRRCAGSIGVRCSSTRRLPATSRNLTGRARAPSPCERC